MSHPISDLLEGLSPRERHYLKCRVIAEFSNLSGRSWTVNRNGHEWTLTLLAAPSFENGVLRLDLGLTRDGVAVPLNNPFRFVNPPICIDDPAGDIVRMWVDANGVTQQRRLREDVLAALRQMVLDAVKDALA